MPVGTSTGEEGRGGLPEQVFRQWALLVEVESPDALGL